MAICISETTRVQVTWSDQSRVRKHNAKHVLDEKNFLLILFTKLVGKVL
jgi:hypothetical protein